MRKTRMFPGDVFVVDDGAGGLDIVATGHGSLRVGAAEWSLELLSMIGSPAFETRPHEAVQIFWRNGVRTFRVVRRNLTCRADDCRDEIDPAGDSEYCSEHEGRSP